MISASKHQINPVGIVLINGDGVYGVYGIICAAPVVGGSVEGSEPQPGKLPPSIGLSAPYDKL